MSTYPKIPGPFKRDPATNKLTEEYTSPELALLADLPVWTFTEKVDGTNLRVYWDGYNVAVKGRTDRATFSASQQNAIADLFLTPEFETLLEQSFGENDIVLYGELYGAGIQSGGNYSDKIRFALFDVFIDGLWLTPDNVHSVALQLGLQHAPVFWKVNTLYRAINLVRGGLHTSVADPSKKAYEAEGLVGVVTSGLLNRRGERIMVKVKARDFADV